MFSNDKKHYEYIRRGDMTVIYAIVKKKSGLPTNRILFRKMEYVISEELDLNLIATLIYHIY